MLSHPLLAQSLPVVAVKTAPTADATGFDQLIKSEKATFTLISQTELATTPDADAEIASEEDALTIDGAVDEPATNPTATSDLGAELELAQRDAETPGLTVHSTTSPSLPQSQPDAPPLAAQPRTASVQPKADSVAADLTKLPVETIEADLAADVDWTAAQKPTDQPATPESPLKKPAVTHETATAPDTPEIAPDAPLTVQTGEVVDADFKANTDSTTPQIVPVSAAPDPLKNPEDLEDKTAQDETPIAVAPAHIPVPETASLEAPKTTDQPSFQSMVVEASAEPVLVHSATGNVAIPAAAVENIVKSDAEAPKDVAFAAPQNRTAPLRTAQADITPRQEAGPAATPAAPTTAASGIVDVNVQAAPATDMPRSFTGTLQKPAVDVQASAPSASAKTAETQPLSDTPASAPIQQLRATLTPLPAPADPQQAPAPQPSKSPIVRQVMDQLVQYPTENGTATIRLKPHGMGVIEITVERTKEGSLTVDMRVQNPLVLEAMRNERGAISHLFQPTATSAGGTLSMDLFQSGAGRNGQDQQGQAAKDTSSTPPDTATEDQKDAPIVAQNQQTRASGVLNILT